MGYNYRTIESTKPGTVCRRCGRWINKFHGHDDWVALRYAREVLKASSVHTHHNTKNLPMIGIDLKLGYTQTLGSFSMEKVLS